MGITRLLKEDLKRFGIDLPVDKRTSAYKQKVREFRIDELYVEHLRGLVREAKQNEKKAKKAAEKAAELARKVANKNNAATKIQIAYERNKLFRTVPTTVWTSYFKYKLSNTRPKLVGMGGTTVEEYFKLLGMDRLDLISYLTVDDFQKFFQFYKVASFLEQKLVEIKGYKLSISYTVNVVYDKGSIEFENFNKTLGAKYILSKSDIFRYLEEVYGSFERKSEESYTNILGLNHINLMITKVNPLSGSSYIPLPEWVANKKAIINIKNEDKLCFLYSVLCGYYKIYQEKDPQRVSKYTRVINERKFKYNDTDMPMKIDKIIHFEKRNNLRINVYGIEEKSIVPLYTSSNRTNDEYPLINLLYITDGTNSHYTYIKNFNTLMCETNDKNSNYVCPYCCQFRTTSKTGIEKHTKYCISGQKVEVPSKKTEIRFEHYKNINECPIRIYSDFETYRDTSFASKSKNGKTTFEYKHIGASFKIFVVSDIPISIPYVMNSKYYTYSSIYHGKDANNEFIRQIQELENILVDDMKNAQELNRDFRNMKISNEQLEDFKRTHKCWVCNSAFKGDKVKHHNHFTGEYHSPLCNACNIQIKDSIKIPVFFHNLNYDKNVFFKSLVNYENIKNVSILPDNEESYKAFSVGKLHFLDSAKFMMSSLDELIKNLPSDSIKFLKQLSKSDMEEKYMMKKGFFPYDWFDSVDKFDVDIKELKQSDFDNLLKMEKCSDENWEYIQQLIKDLNIKTFREYHDFYLNIDVNGLADVFETFRNTSIETYKLDPCHYVGCPSFGWDAMLLKTRVKLELLLDSDMYQFFERGIRGGQSVIFEKYCKANNKYLPDYNPEEQSVYISYLDANNLYGVSMSQKLPINSFEWKYDITEEMIRNYDDKSDVGYVLEVNLHYPKELHDSHNDYPLAPVQYKPKGSICNKLCGTFEDKTDYIVHVKNLKFYLEHGLKLTKISRAVQFKQSNWLKEWIDINTQFRTNAKNDFEKDYFKLMNNAVFGKTMENVRDRIEVKCAFDEKYFKKYASKPNYHSCKDFKNYGKDFMLMKLDKKTVCLDKPIYAGFTILDLSKLHMYNFHYNTMKPLYGDKIRLMMTDTDSLVYRIETVDFYADMKKHSKYFDMSEYSKINPSYDPTNKKVIGKFKDETGDCIPSLFIGVRSKIYTMAGVLPEFYDKLTDSEKKKLNKIKLIKKLKGVPKVVVKNEINVEHYSKCVLENKKGEGDYIAKGITSFRTKELANFTIKQSKLALSNTDDKRVWNGLNSLAYGHYKLGEEL